LLDTAFAAAAAGDLGGGPAGITASEPDLASKHGGANIALNVRILRRQKIDNFWTKA
jgi:hypothetical protein